MAASDTEKAIQQPVLDRLLDFDPRNRFEAPLTREQQIRQLKAALRRDLEWLLNTRQTSERIPAVFRDLRESVYNYGLAEISAFSLFSARDQIHFLKVLETTIARYEPRLYMVNVSMQPPTPTSRVLRFHIEGFLRVDPAPEHIVFDTVLQLASGEYQVEREYAAR